MSAPSRRVVVTLDQVERIAARAAQEGAARLAIYGDDNGPTSVAFHEGDDIEWRTLTGWMRGVPVTPDAEVRAPFTSRDGLRSLRVKLANLRGTLANGQVPNARQLQAWLDDADAVLGMGLEGGDDQPTHGR